MSFHEKSNAAMLLILLAVYGWYFATSAGAILGGLPPETALAVTNVKMILTVVVVVVLSIAAHIAIAIAAPSEADDTADERDKLIEMRGDQRGGVVLGVFAVMAMGLAMLNFPAYMFANTILAGLVAGSVVAGLSRLIDYRRGV
ncbi:MAG: hypothetical protein VX529_07405 [Pseudomonadota bacterium]|nr:hypothetical protein [Pseudomonadota bacterium]